MTRYGAQLGPDVTSLGVPRCDDIDRARGAPGEATARRRLDAEHGTAWDAARPLLSGREASGREREH